MIKSPQDIAQAFNQYLVNIAQNIDKEIPITGKCPLDYLCSRTAESFFIPPTVSSEIDSIISKLHKGKSVGRYIIPINLLKILSPNIASSLASLTNKSISTGIFLDKLKAAKITALHKKGDTDNPSNCRSMSLLSIFSEMFEKVMHKRFYNFFEVNEILHPLQFGFRKKHSTLHTLISMTERIKNTIDTGNYGCGIFIDLKKAVDTVNHGILLKKLEHYRVRGIPLQWSES